MSRLQIESRVKFTCPLCANEDAVVSLARDGSYYIICFACRDRNGSGLSGGDYLREVAKEVGAPKGGALKDDPERWLASYFNGSFRRGPNGRPAELPSLGSVRGWYSALLCHKRAYRYLRDDRQLSRIAIRGANIGYAKAPGPYHDYWAFTLPVFAAPNELINLRKRFWPRVPDGTKYVGLAGRGSQLYPSLPRRNLHNLDVLLVAGEFDALIGRQTKLPAVSTTCGAHLPPQLVESLADDGKQIAVMFDVGEERAAERAVELLREAGADAWKVDLPLTEKGADLSDYISAGATRTELLELIHDARRS